MIRVFQSDVWDEKRFWYMILFLLLLSWVALYLFIKNAAIEIVLEHLSKTRGTTSELDEYRTYGHLRFIIGFSNIVLFLVIVKMFSCSTRRLLELFILLLSGVTSIFYYFLVQSRSSIVSIFIIIIAISYYLKNKKLPIVKILIGGFFSLFFFKWMSNLRSGMDFYESNPFNNNILKVIEPIILNRNGFDISKTAHIINTVGTPQLDYQYGKTIFDVFLMWIPRELWQNKPVKVDTLIGFAVYDANVYGAGAVPPGLIAEMYLNFWFPGVFIGCFCAGYLLGKIYNQFNQHLSNRNAILLYTVSGMRLGGALLGSGASAIVIQFLTTFTPLYIVLYIITKKNNSST